MDASVEGRENCNSDSDDETIISVCSEPTDNKDSKMHLSFGINTILAKDEAKNRLESYGDSETPALHSFHFAHHPLKLFPHRPFPLAVGSTGVFPWMQDRRERITRKSKFVYR